MNKPSNLMLIVAGVLSFWVLTQPALADLHNGDFSDDFTWNTDPTLDWHVESGIVQHVLVSGDGKAKFIQGDPDNQYSNSTLKQIFELDSEALELSFE